MITDREKHGFVGPVQSVRTKFESGPSRSYKLIEGRRELWKDYSDNFIDPSDSTEEQPTAYEIFIFDSAGRLLKDASVDRQCMEQEPYGYIYGYDEKGRINEKLFYNRDGSSKGKMIYSYDPDGKKREEIYYNKDGSKVYTMKFDHRSNLTEMSWFDSDDSVTQKEINTYNYKFEGNRVEEIYEHEEIELRVKDPTGTSYPILGRATEFNYEDGQLTIKTDESKLEECSKRPKEPEQHRTVITYDDSGNIIERLEYRPSWCLFSREIYDSGGRILEQAYNWDLDDILERKAIFIYDEKGKLIEQFDTFPEDYRGKQEPIKRNYKYKYDHMGNLIEFLIYDADGSLRYRESNTYEYDSYGNWIKRTKTDLNNKWQAEPFPAVHESIDFYYRTIIYY